MAVAFAVAVALLLGLVGAAVAATPATVRLVGDDPSYGSRLSIKAPGGGTFSADPGPYTVVVTPQGGGPEQHIAWCVDVGRQIASGRDYSVNLLTASDDPALDGASYQAAGWLAAKADGLIADAANAGREAAAIQVAIWQLTGQAADRFDVTTDTALNMRVWALRAMAQDKTLARELAIQAPDTLTEGGVGTVTVTGTPGAVVTLEVTAGDAGLSASQVTLGADGGATVELTVGAGPGVTVIARSDGHRLTKVAHLPGRRTPQDLIYVTPVALTASAAVAVTPAPVVVVPPTVVPPVTEVPTPVVPPVVTPPAETAPTVTTPPTTGGVTQVPRTRLGLVKSAPATIVAGRSITYTLTVRNVGTVTARGVVVRDPLPAGTYLRRRPKGVTIRNGVVVYRVGTLAPGAKRTLRLQVRVPVTRTARVDNVATASASNARTVRARAVTAIVAVLPAVQPAVTG